MSETVPVTTTRKVLRIGTLSTIGRSDPREAADTISGMVLGQVYEAPYELAGGTTVRPRLLEPLRAEKELQYSAAIRPGIHFSDGTPLTADLVARSLRATKALLNKAIIEVVGDRVWFTLSAPNARFDLALTQESCAVVLDRNGQLLGTGPFMFESQTNGRGLLQEEKIRLVRNPYYTNANAVDEVQFVAYPAEIDGTPRKLIEALRRGDVDVTNSITMAELATHQISGFAPALQPGNSTGILFFNTEHRVLASSAVRRAIAMAIDVHEIAVSSFDKNPVAFIAPTLLPPMMERSVGIPENNPDEARKLLKGSEATRGKLTLLVPWAPRPYLPKPLPVAIAVQRQLSAVGVNTELVQPKTNEAFFNDLATGNYDLALAGWVADTPDPADFFEALLWSKMTEGVNHSNLSRWRNAAMDAALARFRDQPTDENRRAIHKLIREEAPLLPLTYGQSVVMHSRRIRNLLVSATGVLSLAGVSM